MLDERISCICLLLLLYLIYPSAANLPPQFTSDLSPPFVHEDAPVGTTVLLLRAIDPEGSRLKYGLQGTSQLKVDPFNGAVTVVKPLDREDKDTLKLVVTVEDEVQGEDNNVVRVPLDLVVLDVNDNPPVFSRNSFEAEVPEDTKVGSKVLDGILLSDLDQIGEVLTIECINKKDGKSCQRFEFVPQQRTSRQLSGSLVLKKTLDFTEENSYQLTLTAFDGENRASVPLSVKVTDVQNTPPIFTGSTTGVITEKASIGTLVMTLHAEDGDRGNPRTIMYELIRNPLDFFLLDAESGELRTAKPLDREAIDNQAGVVDLMAKAYEVEENARSSDPDSETTLAFTVTIQDVNDEAPTFNQKEYYVSIPENLPPGTPVPDLHMSVEDTDVGKNSMFSLRLANSVGRFAIEPTAASGSTSLSLRLTGKESLDYENPNERQFILLVIAEEIKTNPRLSSTSTIHVSVTDTNDNAPTFQQEAYTSIVSETASPGTVVTTILANDRDTGDFGVNGIRYSIFGNGAEKFMVDATSGIITVAPCQTPGSGNCLDYESRVTYFLSYQAKDSDGDGHTAVVPIRISLKDENDNAPRFTRSTYKAVIQEGAKDFDPPLIVKATDSDVSSRVRYNIVGGDSKDLFVLDQRNGRIRVRGNNGLDMSDTGRNEIILTVEASDGSASHTAEVRISVRDVNNNSPIFSKDNYIASIQENSHIGAIVEKVSATDADIGENAAIYFEVMKGAYDDFEIDKASGEIAVKRHLNYDTRNFYYIEIIARDKGFPQLTSTAFLNITVIDNNDKNPYFVPTTQRVSVNENAPPGTFVHQLIAADQDVAHPEGLRFESRSVTSAVNKEGALLDANERVSLLNVIAISPTGQVTLARPLNRNITTELTVSVSVTDQTANPPQMGKGFLVITIVDVNDHPPMFPSPWSPENPVLEVTTLEELPRGSLVTTLVATDEDSNIEGYEFVNPSGKFSLDRITGVVSVKGRLDYETEQSVTEVVIVKDTGIPQMSATATLVVKLKNINDEEPVFEEPEYEAEIFEHSPPGTEILTVSATDGDKQHLGTVVYSLAGDHMQYFSIDSSTGRISTLPGADIDREIISEMRLRAVATDSGPKDTRKQTSVPIHIKVLDINDHEPKFIQKTFKASILENISLNPPVPVLQAKAVDKDAGMNAALRYTITGGTGEDLFRVDSATGILYPARRMRTSGKAKTYTLDLQVTDLNGTGTAIDTARAVIVVIPQNENKPIFVSPPQPKFKVQIRENASEVQVTVLTVSAKDKDLGANGEVSYHLKVGNENVQETDEFYLDAKTGVLTTKKILDREEKAEYELILVAKDQGSPISYESLRVLTVTLEDIEDNLPLFPSDENGRRYSFSLLENRPPNTLLGQVKAYDADFGKNAKIFYYIINGNVNNNFNIDKASGNLYASVSLDREERNLYNLVVKASNDPNYNGQSETRLQIEDGTLAFVNIQVLDENDTPPRFPMDTFYAGVPFYSEVNRLVRMVSARDDDEGRNGSISYSIRSSTFYRPGESKPVGSIVPSPFNITSEGKLLTATQMAPYRRHRFLLEIQAKELAPPHRTHTAHVNIWVWERDKLIKVVIAEPPDEIVEKKDEISNEISEVLKGIAVIDEIRYFTFENNTISKDWTEMLIHVVNNSGEVESTENVLKKVDRGYANLIASPSTSKIRKIYPAASLEQEQIIDARMAGLIALLIALLVGFISFIAVCCCLRFWVMTPTKSREQLIHRSIDEDLGLNTTENPLWLDQKLKSYEEQELSMQVMSEFDPSSNTNAIINVNGRGHIDAQSNTYATIQKSHGGTIRSLQLRALQQGAGTLMIGDDPGESNDYATLEYLRRGGPLHNGASTPNRHGPRVPGVETPLSAAFAQERDTPEMKELATSFTGSTFQPPDPSNMANRPLPEEPPGMASDSPGRNRPLVVNSHGEPVLVAELI